MELMKVLDNGTTTEPDNIRRKHDRDGISSVKNATRTKPDATSDHKRALEIGLWENGTTKSKMLHLAGCQEASLTHEVLQN